MDHNNHIQALWQQLDRIESISRSGVTVDLDGFMEAIRPISVVENGNLVFATTSTEAVRAATFALSKL